MAISLASGHRLVTDVPPRAPLGSWPPPCHMGHGGGGVRSAQSGAGHFPTLGLGFPSSKGAAATSFGVSGPLESPLLPAGGPSASLRYTAVSYSQGTDSSPIHLQALGSSGQEPGGGGGGRRVSTCTPTCVGHACTHTPTTHTHHVSKLSSARATVGPTLGLLPRPAGSNLLRRAGGPP